MVTGFPRGEMSEGNAGDLEEKRGTRQHGRSVAEVAENSEEEQLRFTIGLVYAAATEIVHTASRERRSLHRR